MCILHTDSFWEEKASFDVVFKFSSRIRFRTLTQTIRSLFSETI